MAVAETDSLKLLADEVALNHSKVMRSQRMLSSVSYTNSLQWAMRMRLIWCESSCRGCHVMAKVGNLAGPEYGFAAEISNGYRVCILHAEGTIEDHFGVGLSHYVSRQFGISFRERKAGPQCDRIHWNRFHLFGIV